MNAAYPGLELDLFATAVRWKSYVGDVLRPHISGRVAEIGAGIGTNIPYLTNDSVTRWLCIEPDPRLAERISDGIATAALPQSCIVRTGAVQNIDPTDRFDTILYIDVIEHIADDVAEFHRAAALLAPGGRLIVLAPAHPFLFSPFDTAVGHHRRYNRKSLRALSNGTMTPIFCRYFDSVGYLASLGNRMVLRASVPTPAQIKLWDRVLVPLSRIVDPMLGHRFGKTIVGIWTAPRDNQTKA